MTNLFSACILSLSLSLSSKDNLLIESHRSCENLFSISTLHHFQHNPERVFKLLIEFSLPSVAARCGSPQAPHTQTISPPHHLLAE